MYNIAFFRHIAWTYCSLPPAATVCHWRLMYLGLLFTTVCIRRLPNAKRFTTNCLSRQLCVCVIRALMTLWIRNNHALNHSNMLYCSDPAPSMTHDPWPMTIAMFNNITQSSRFTCISSSSAVSSSGTEGWHAAVLALQRCLEPNF